MKIFTLYIVGLENVQSCASVGLKKKKTVAINLLKAGIAKVYYIIFNISKIL